MQIPKFDSDTAYALFTVVWVLIFVLPSMVQGSLDGILLSPIGIIIWLVMTVAALPRLVDFARAGQWWRFGIMGTAFLIGAIFFVMMISALI